MTQIRLATECFDAADALRSILTRRMFDVSDLTSGEDTTPQGSILMVSNAYQEKCGGRDHIVELARQSRARQILVIREDQEQFAVTTDLGGKMLNIDLPKRQVIDPAIDYGLNLIASLIDANGHLAVGSTSSEAMLTLAKKVAATDVTVFINGPTGTGKEVLSRFVHDHSSRKDQAFVGINCAAIPDNMLEAILFGHEKGAFTGASTANKGIFRAADGGTLLLDEISEMPLGLQAKLLRVLQEKLVTPLGSQNEISVDVRVIATTNRSMAEEIQQGRFREDLFYRLNVFPLQTTSMAERKDDIIPITTALLKRHHSDLETFPWITDEAVALLTGHDWPGNVRELENVLQRALVLMTDGQITPDDIIFDTTMTHMLTPPSNPTPLEHAVAQ
jgi:two-component system response regulator FlrC